MVDHTNHASLRKQREALAACYSQRAALWRTALWIFNGLFAVFGSAAVLLLFSVSIRALAPYAMVLSAQLALARALRRRRDAASRRAEGYLLPFAEEVLDAGEPFALYLRGFEREAAAFEYAGPDEELGGAPSPASRRTESLFAAMLSLRILTLQNPQTPGPATGACRFHAIAGEGWLDVVRTAAARARLIVVEFRGPSAGIDLKADLLVRSGLAARTLLVITRECSVAGTPQSAQLRQWFQAFPFVIFEAEEVGWSRRQEAAFHARAAERVRELLAQGGTTPTEVMAERAVLPTAVVPWTRPVVSFVAGPALWTLGMLPLLVLVEGSAFALTYGLLALPLFLVLKLFLRLREGAGLAGERRMDAWLARRDLTP